MKRLVGVSAFEFSTKWPSYTYINKDYMYNVKCTVLRRNLGLLKDSYLLELNGKEEDIQMFLDYLKYEGFRIKWFE